MSSQSEATKRLAAERIPRGSVGWRARGISAWSGPVLAVLAAVSMVLPLLWMFISSLKTDAESFRAPPTLWPEEPTVAAYGTVLTETPLPMFMRNSFLVAVATTIAVSLLAVCAAYALVRFQFPGAEWLTRSTLLFYSMPPILLVVPIVQVFVTLRLVNSLLSLMVVYTALYLPVGIWLLRGYFIGLDKSPEEAARVDGAGRFQAFWRIGVPQAIPGIGTVGVFTFNAAWNEYLYASVLVQQPNSMTMSAGLATFVGEISIYSWPVLMAAGVMAISPVFVMFLFAQRYIAGTFGAGPVRG